MRIFFLSLFVCGMLSANPIAEQQNTYIASQVVEITLAASDVRFHCSYLFRATHPTSKSESGETITLEIPLWFPLTSPSDRSVTRFWQTFSKDAQNVITVKNRRIFEEAIGLKVRSAKAQAEIDSFLVYASRRQQNALNESWRMPGFACLLFSCQISVPVSASETRITITYREPYDLAHGKREFLYVPMFENLPPNITTATSRRYSVFVHADEYLSATIKNGNRTIKLGKGSHAQLRPVHQQAIQGAVASRTE